MPINSSGFVQDIIGSIDAPAIPVIIAFNKSLRFILFITASKIKFEQLPWKQDAEIYKNHTHGEEWHRKMISAAADYFKKDNYQTTLEPMLNLGRADIGAYFDALKSPIYIEIGTTSLYKLLYNLLTMENSIFLIIPAEEYMIEFRT